MTTSRMTTLRTTATTARTTGKDNDDRDDNSGDNGDNGKDDNNDGGNDDSGGGGGGEIGGEVDGVARLVTWLVAVFFAIGCLVLTYRRNCTDTFGNKFILVSSYCLGTFDGIVKKNMPGKLFFLSLASSSVLYVHTLYPRALQYIAN
jgi:hypothetical protein